MRWRHPKDVTSITDPDSDPLTVNWAQPPRWADSDGALAGVPLDDGDPYNDGLRSPAADTEAQPQSPPLHSVHDWRVLPARSTTPCPRGQVPSCGRRHDADRPAWLDRSVASPH